MKIYKIGDLFSGGGGIGEATGIAQSRYDCNVEYAWGLEIDPRIAEVARTNGHNVMVQDVCAADPDDYDDIDFLHASTPCTRISQSSELSENADDLAMATAVIRFVEAKQPILFTLENVREYLGSKSESLITNGLERLGYRVTSKIICFANYGLPQKRIRLIMFAHKEGGSLFFPPTTHKEVKPIHTKDMFTLPWRTWLEVVADLIPTLEEKPLSPWQQRKFPPNPPIGACLVGSQSRRSNQHVMVVGKNKPMITVTTNTGSRNRIRIDGRTLKVNMECVKRWQGFRDSFVLPPQIGLSGIVLGRAVPPPVYAQFLKHWIQSLE